MRIAEVNDVASVATELSAGLRARGHEVRLIHPRLVGAALPTAVKPAVAPLRAWEWASIAREIRGGHYDAVHIHYAYLGMIGVLGRFPYILHCHGDDVRDLDRAIRRPFIKLAMKRAAFVYYATPDLRDRVIALRPDAEFLPNPIDTALFRPQPPETNGPDIFIGCSLTENKGIANILEACERLAVARPDLRITAIAGGEFTAAFDALPQVTLITKQSRPKFAATIARHRVVIGQTHEGAIGMAELEAMACARPVIAHFIYDDAYSEPPPIVRAHSGEEIARAVLATLDGGDEVGEASRAWIERHHEVGAISKRVEARLEWLAAR
jgi:glycosyltransferase involved in cell wall biosynthesis